MIQFITVFNKIKQIESNIYFTKHKIQLKWKLILGKFYVFLHSKNMIKLKRTQTKLSWNNDVDESDIFWVISI